MKNHQVSSDDATSSITHLTDALALMEQAQVFTNAELDAVRAQIDEAVARRDRDQQLAVLRAKIHTLLQADTESLRIRRSVLQSLHTNGLLSQGSALAEVLIPTHTQLQASMQRLSKQIDTSGDMNHLDGVYQSLATRAPRGQLH